MNKRQNNSLQINGDSTINEAAYKSIIIAMKPDGYKESVMVEIAENCSKLVKMEEEKYQKDEKKSKCSPVIWTAIKCTNDGLLNACPEKLKIKSKKCVKPHYFNMYELGKFDYSL